MSETKSPVKPADVAKLAARVDALEARLNAALTHISTALNLTMPAAEEPGE